MFIHVSKIGDGALACGGEGVDFCRHGMALQCDQGAAATAQRRSQGCDRQLLAEHPVCAKLIARGSAGAPGDPHVWRRAGLAQPIPHALYGIG